MNGARQNQPLNKEAIIQEIIERHSYPNQPNRDNVQSFQNFFFDEPTVIPQSSQLLIVSLNQNEVDLPMLKQYLGFRRATLTGFAEDNHISHETATKLFLEEAQSFSLIKNYKPFIDLRFINDTPELIYSGFTEKYGFGRDARLGPSLEENKINPQFLRAVQSVFARDGIEQDINSEITTDEIEDRHGRAEQLWQVVKITITFKNRFDVQGRQNPLLDEWFETHDWATKKTLIDKYPQDSRPKIIFTLNREDNRDVEVTLQNFNFENDIAIDHILNLLDIILLIIQDPPRNNIQFKRNIARRAEQIGSRKEKIAALQSYKSPFKSTGLYTKGWNRFLGPNIAEKIIRMSEMGNTPQHEELQNINTNIFKNFPLKKELQNINTTLFQGGRRKKNSKRTQKVSRKQKNRSTRKG